MRMISVRALSTVDLAVVEDNVYLLAQERNFIPLSIEVPSRCLPRCPQISLFSTELHNLYTATCHHHHYFTTATTATTTTTTTPTQDRAKFLSKVPFFRSWNNYKLLRIASSLVQEETNKVGGW